MGNSNSEPQRVSIDRDSFNISVSAAAIEELRRVSNNEKSLQLAKEESHSFARSNKTGIEEDSNDILKTNEQIRLLEANYEKRLSNIEKKNGEIFEEAAEEFKRSLERVEKKFLQPSKQPCCQSLLDAVEKCYTDNSNKVLFCSSLVNDYNVCVNEYREAMLVKYSKSAEVL